MQILQWNSHGTSRSLFILGSKGMIRGFQIILTLIDIIIEMESLMVIWRVGSGL